LNTVIDIDPPTAEARRLWANALELARDFGADDRWALVGGLMVQLHAFERNRSSRLTADVEGTRRSGCRRSKYCSPSTTAP
jgi:hypothetical protein